MTVYDWIVVGNGITGATVSYELAATGQTVLLVDRHTSMQNATRYSYGGIAYWAGTTPVLQQLCMEGRARYPQLADELGQTIEFRELDLLLTVDVSDDPTTYESRTSQFLVSPHRISVDEACELEPLLNRAAISGAFTVKHGNVNPEAMVAAYNSALKRNGGTITSATVQEFQWQSDRISGIYTDQGGFSSKNVLISNGAWARSLLRSTGINVRQCFSHAELIETPSLDVQLRTLVMPMNLKRFGLEAKAGSPDVDHLWDEDGHEITSAILDAGVVQFQDGRIRIGQITRALTDLNASIDMAHSERLIRESIGNILPALQKVPGRLHRCHIAFCGDRLPLIGSISDKKGLHIFSGFSNPFAILPSLAKRFAAHMTGYPDDIISQLSPKRHSLRR